MSWLRAWRIEKEIFWQEDWESEFGGDSPEKLQKINKKYYKPYGAVLLLSTQKEDILSRVMGGKQANSSGRLYPDYLNLSSGGIPFMPLPE